MPPWRAAWWTPRSAPFSTPDMRARSPRSRNPSRSSTSTPRASRPTSTTRSTAIEQRIADRLKAEVERRAGTFASPSHGRKSSAPPSRPRAALGPDPELQQPECRDAGEAACDRRARGPSPAAPVGSAGSPRGGQGDLHREPPDHRRPQAVDRCAVRRACAGHQPAQGGGLVEGCARLEGRRPGSRAGSRP